jgi:dynein assembly factor 3
LVRGFWGDIINSPYMSYGNEIHKEPERTRFFKKVNYQSVYSNADISEFSVQYYLHMLEELEEYDFPFERLKHVLGDQYEDPHKKKMEEKAKKEAEKKKKEKDDEEPMIEEVTDE